MTLTCPICKKKQVAVGDPDFPFCSERCRLVDLGNWASGKYVIPGAERPGSASDTADDDKD